MSTEDHNDPSENTLAPRPLPGGLFLQIASWLTGIAGGLVFMSTLTLSTTRVSGATKASRLRWQERVTTVPERIVETDTPSSRADLLPRPGPTDRPNWKPARTGEAPASKTGRQSPRAPESERS